MLLPNLERVVGLSCCYYYLSSRYIGCKNRVLTKVNRHDESGSETVAYQLDDTVSQSNPLFPSPRLEGIDTALTFNFKINFRDPIIGGIVGWVNPFRIESTDGVGMFDGSGSGYDSMIRY